MRSRFLFLSPAPGGAAHHVVISIPTQRSRSYTKLYTPFIWVALALALLAGFGYGAILVWILALGQPSGILWVATVQAHGHVQLFGWGGLFVVGVSLYFLPRLRGSPLVAAPLTPWVATLLGTGIALRGLAQPVLGLAADPGSPLGCAGRLGFGISGLLEWAGASLAAGMLAATFRQGRAPLRASQAVWPVFPFLAMAYVAFWLAGTTNAGLTLVAGWQGSAFFPQAWDEALTHAMLSGFLVPVAMAVSVRTLPLFLTLAPAPREALVPIAGVYLVGLILRITGLLAGQDLLMGLGSVLEGVAVLGFIWLLDVLLRRRAPWTTTREVLPQAAPSGPGRRPTRGILPDYGEYGRFEWLIQPAYAWLAIAGLLALANGLSMILRQSPLLPFDAERHAIAVGFITLLIMGMAVRMLPGIAGQRAVASLRLVEAMLWLGNGMALFRVGPLLLMPVLLGTGWSGAMAIADLARVTLGMSGVVGWLAIACLAVNLWWTFHPGTRRNSEELRET